MSHLSLKLVSWFHQGKWLAEPLANVLQKRGIYPKISCIPFSIKFRVKILHCSNAYINVLKSYMLSQTTDSASSNNTMASRVFDILAETNGTYTFDWRPHNMHIRCFFHKISLIVNAVLAELGMIAPPPAKVKESILGKFPYSDVMEPIAEVEEEMAEENNDQAGGAAHETNSSIDGNDISEPEHNEEELARLGDQQEKEEEDNNQAEYQAENCNESNSLDRLTINA
jgi:hypothetical protein